MMFNKLKAKWVRLWMRFAGLSPFGRFATWLATWFAPPYKARHHLAFMNRQGYIAPTASIHHDQLRLGKNVFIGDRVIIYQTKDGGSVQLGDRVHIWGDSLFETGEGGSITVGPYSRINHGVQLVSYKAAIQIGRDVGLGYNSALYSYDHGIAPDQPYLEQPLQTKGPIIIDDHAWIGVGVIVMSGVRIGKHAVVAAGSVVTRDVPDGAIAVGVPARVVKMRTDLPDKPIEASSTSIPVRAEGKIR